MLILIILDGFGLSDSKKFNAISQANMPNWNKLIKSYAFGLIKASGDFVGLPKDQFGNSEVGHLIIGSGRVVRQDITRINYSILNKSLFSNNNLNAAITNNSSGTFHLFGVLSDGGVHGHIDHIITLIKYLETIPKITKVYLHAFLDGRDVPPQSSQVFYNFLKKSIIECRKFELATVIGRYYAMDRDNRYERTKLAYDLIMSGSTKNRATNFDELINCEYKNGVNDEFVPPYNINDYHGMCDGDTVLFTNFRPDRAIQLTKSFVESNFDFFQTKKINLSDFITMTTYDAKLNIKALFKQELIKNTLGEMLSKNKLKQLRIAETEKYPHVTYFFNGRNTNKSENEDWILVPSPRDIATYDLKPEMSLPEVTEKIIDAIEKNKYDVIITNFANGDMVGHTGCLEATIKAVECIDLAVGKIVAAMAKIKNAEIIITADHGNCEEMFDLVSNQPITQHTTNPVPFLYIGRKAKISKNGSLKDIAPTILNLLSIEVPDEMEGENLIEFVVE